MADSQTTTHGLDYERRKAERPGRPSALGRSLAGAGLGAMVTPIAIFAALVSAGAGHGKYVAAKILFPYTMLSTDFFTFLHPMMLAFAFIQFPAYGFFVCRPRSWRRRILWAVTISASHLLAAAACFGFR